MVSYSLRFFFFFFFWAVDLVSSLPLPIDSLAANTLVSSVAALLFRRGATLLNPWFSFLASVHSTSRRKLRPDPFSFPLPQFVAHSRCKERQGLVLLRQPCFWCLPLLDDPFSLLTTLFVLSHFFRTHRFSLAYARFP